MYQFTLQAEEVVCKSYDSGDWDGQVEELSPGYFWAEAKSGFHPFSVAGDGDTAYEAMGSLKNGIHDRHCKDHS